MGKLNHPGNRKPKQPQKGSENVLKLIPGGSTVRKLNKPSAGEQAPSTDSSKEPPKTKTKPTEEETKRIDDEYQRELEWRETEVAKVFREGRNRIGRPSKLTDLVIRDAEVLARIGLSERAIAESLMVSHETLLNWLKTNKAFFNRLKAARSKGKSVLINSIYGHGRKSWQATAWLLERMYRNEFGLNPKIELSGAGGEPLTFRVVYEEKKASPEKAAQELTQEG